jgi:lantibiotic modifying enzyme
MRLDPEQAAYHESLARAALGTTLTALDTSLQSPRFDATLCHGLAGLAEIVQIYAETIDDDNARQVVQNTAAELIRRYDEAGDWPSGQMTGGLNPTLMLGNAGIGHHLLRLHAPQAVPSVLIIESRSTEAQTAGSAR